MILNVDEDHNDRAVLLYLLTEKNKMQIDDNISGEYSEKVILFGYLIVSEFNELNI
jgi:hypothetical protein